MNNWKKKFELSQNQDFLHFLEVRSSTIEVRVQPVFFELSSRCSKFGFAKVRMFEVRTFWVRSNTTAYSLFLLLYCSCWWKIQTINFPSRLEESLINAFCNSTQLGSTLKPRYNEPRYSEFHDIVNKTQLPIWGFTKHITYDKMNYSI